MRVLDEYEQLLRRATGEIDHLFTAHRSSVRCGKGCSGCCDDIQVLPLEWYTLARWLLRNRRYLRASLRHRGAGENRCPFLRKADESCCVYPLRPLICRLHGLPIRYPVEEYDAFGQRVLGEAGEWCFSWCELNFTGLDSSAAGEYFCPGEYVEMESWNRQLKALNLSFLSRGGAEELAHLGLSGERGWLPLSALERLL